jgi:hypothetical protein
MGDVSDKRYSENQDIHFTFNNFLPLKIVPFMRKCGNVWYSHTGHRLKYGACALPAGSLTLQTHSQNHCFHGNNGYTNVPQCYVIRTLHVSPKFKETQTRIRTMYRVEKKIA